MGVVKQHVALPHQHGKIVVGGQIQREACACVNAYVPNVELGKRVRCAVYAVQAACNQADCAAVHVYHGDIFAA